MAAVSLRELLHHGLVWHHATSNTTATATAWSLANLAGRYVELTARGPAARLTIAGQLVLEAQLAREPAAWITARDSSFHPTDLAHNGVDLGALVVVRVPNAVAMLRASETLLRAGAFSLVVIDLQSAKATFNVPLPVQTRLVGLAQHHDTLLLCLTHNDDSTPHALSSLRAEASLQAIAGNGSSFESRLEVVKDKRAAPGWRYVFVCRAVQGMA